ncbi:MAG: PEP-CTERM sorting domain-containing protein [Pseudomonadota bacterium]
MSTFKTLLIAFAALGPTTALAGLIDFRYEFSGGSVLAGQVDGTVQADGDTFVVNGFGTVTLDDIALNPIDPGDICSGADFPRCVSVPLMSFSGTVMDVFVCALGFSSWGNCSFARDGGFYFATAGRYQFARAGNRASGLVTDWDYGPGNWSARLVDDVVAVPEPGTAALLGLGALVAWSRRRRSTS